MRGNHVVSYRLCVITYVVDAIPDTSLARVQRHDDACKGETYSRSEFADSHLRAVVENAQPDAWSDEGATEPVENFDMVPAAVRAPASHVPYRGEHPGDGGTVVGSQLSLHQVEDAAAAERADPGRHSLP